MYKISGLPETFRRIGIADKLSNELVKYFLRIRDELQSSDLERASTGKFVETVVQVLQCVESDDGSFQHSVKDVDGELRKFETQSIRRLSDESRVALVRTARAIQCLRSKRSLVHKNSIDPNEYDLEFIYDCAQWIMTELVRSLADTNVVEARSIIEEIQKPVLPIVENILGRSLVLDSSLTTESEAILILYRGYSEGGTMSRTEIGKALDRCSSPSVTRALDALWKSRMIEGNGKLGYRLTGLGVQEAKGILSELAKGSESQTSGSATRQADRSSE